jgi:hypothetical protein
MKWKRTAIKSESLARRLAGVSAFGFGVSWKAGESEREMVRGVITLLEDRRALFVETDLNILRHVQRSMETIRHALTDGLAKLPESSPAATSFRAMRAVCREMMDQPRSSLIDRYVESKGNVPVDQLDEIDLAYAEKLGKLRVVFGQHLAMIAYQYDVEIEEGLASILPPEPEKSDGKRPDVATE